MSGNYWPAGTIVRTAYVDSNRPDSAGTEADVCAAIDAACAAWERVCGVRFGDAASLDAANVQVVWADLDPTGCMLGLTDEPARGYGGPLLLRLDYASAWTPARSFLALVHELGHALGFDHSPLGVIAIMSAYLNDALSGPTEYDARLAVAAYGPPAPVKPLESAAAADRPPAGAAATPGPELQAPAATPLTKGPPMNALENVMLTALEPVLVSLVAKAIQAESAPARRAPPPRSFPSCKNSTASSPTPRRGPRWIRS